MLSALKSIFTPSPLKQQAYAAYGRIVEQSRKPVFYKEWQVEDTLDGRFDVIALHMFLVLSRCKAEDGEAQEFSRSVSEAFFSDMDRSLREMGASDTGVGIRVKKMAEAFYGRMKAYREADGSETALAEALKRNVYRDRPVDPAAAASLAAYMGRNALALRQQAGEAIAQGDIRFCG